MRSGNFNQPNGKFNRMSKFVNDFPPEEENIRNQHMGKINNEFPLGNQHMGKINNEFPLRKGSQHMGDDKFSYTGRNDVILPLGEEIPGNQHNGKIDNDFPRGPHIGKISDIFPQREKTPGNGRKSKIDNDLPLIEDVIKQRKISPNEDFPLGKGILGNKHIWSD